jgi:hypothetical protein
VPVATAELVAVSKEVLVPVATAELVAVSKEVLVPVATAELVAVSRELAVTVSVSTEVAVPKEESVADPIGLSVIVATTVTLGLSTDVSETDGYTEYEGKDDIDASNDTVIFADTDDFNVAVAEPTGERELDHSAEEERESRDDEETLAESVPVLELVKDLLGVAECDPVFVPVVVVLTVLEIAGVPVLNWLAV